MTPRPVLAAYFAWRFLTRQWFDVFYWSAARVSHSLMRLRKADRLTDHQLMSLMSWHAHQTEKATKHRSAPVEGGRPRGHRHYDALSHYLAESARRPALATQERDALEWIREVHAAYDLWRRTPGHINITPPAAVGPGESPRRVAPADLSALMHTRASARMWQAREVADDVIAALIDAGLQAPSSCNRQGVVTVIAKRAFPRELREGVNNPFMLHNAPVIIYVAADPSLYPERQAPALDAGMAAQNIVLLAETYGLATCPMYHSESVDQKRLRAQTGIPRNLYVYVALLIGYPAELVVKPRRLSHALRSRWIRE